MYLDIQKPTQMSGFLFGGAGGYRTPVQTSNKINFYMFILFYFSRLIWEKATIFNP